MDAVANDVRRILGHKLWRNSNNCATIAPRSFVIRAIYMISKSMETLLLTIEAAPEGLSMAGLLARHPDIPRRTAQRWVSALVGDGRIAAVGAGRARRYLPIARAAASAIRADDGLSSFLAYSEDSRAVLDYVAQPLEARQPVGYDIEFLHAYQPNETFYLAAPLRRQLHRMGDTGQRKLAAGTYSKAILNRLLIDLSWASSHLEGNTYSLLDTQALIERGKAAEGKALFETQMILNHKAAIELLVDNAEAAAFNRYTLLNLHGTLSENLLPNPADEGRLRQHVVEIGRSVYRPVSIPQQLDALLDTFLGKAGRIADPFEQSFFTMVHLPYLQPFADVNKRTSRLMANLPLIRANLCPLTFLGVPETAYSHATLGVYEMTRVEPLRDLYLHVYDRSTRDYLAITQTLVEPDPMRLIHRDLIKQAVRDAIRYRDDDPIERIHRSLGAHAPTLDTAVLADLEAMVVEDLRQLHEGVLARYGLRPAQYALWRERWKRTGVP